MVENPVVSILILAYNHEKYISKALESVLTQVTEYSFEIIIGNDCSTDHTAAIIAHYCDKYPNIIRCIQSKQNMGATKIFYKMIKSARGRYLAQLEGDDYWSSEKKLQKQISFLESHTEYIGCSTRCIVVDKDEQPIKSKNDNSLYTFWNFPKKVYSIKDFERGSYPGHFNSLVYRNIFLADLEQAKIIYQSHPIIADRTIAMLLAMHGRIYRLDEALSCYRFVECSKDSNYQSETRKKNLRGLEYAYICRLENYANKVKKEQIDLYEIKKDKLVCATVFMLKQPNRENRKTVSDMLRRSLPAGKYLKICLLTIIQKVYFLKILKEDRPVKI